MTIADYFHQIKTPLSDSHKGDNGKLLIIGGSDLFHAASKWSLDVASKFVDMVFYSSVPSNNELIMEAKKNFWNGIVIAREDIENYIEEADCILIGPGMTRDAETKRVVDDLLKKYSHKKWVIDAGALQEVDPQLLQPQMIITPHWGELERVVSSLNKDFGDLKKLTPTKLQELSKELGGVTVVLKGEKDFVFNNEVFVEVSGGNAGMTKGGTGDVLAGLVAGLYTTQEQMVSAVVASEVNKKAGDRLYEKVGPNFNASDLVNEIPTALWDELKSS